MNFEYHKNEDGSFSIFNNEIGDIYFSNVGAYKEAMEKFVLPAFKYKENFILKEKIKILDACYGMGYNSKTFLNYIFTNNIKIDVEIDEIDIDKNILAFGLLISDKNISPDIHKFFICNLMNQINLDKNLEKISGENWIKYIFDDFYIFCEENFRKLPTYLYQNNKITALLHNIYYQTQQNVEHFPFLCKLNFKNDNLLKFLKNSSVKYDIIFHDAFSILKQPELWSDELIELYFNSLNKGGIFLTYSNSRVLRRRLENAGFSVEINTTGDRKQNGTIGIK